MRTFLILAIGGLVMGCSERTVVAKLGEPFSRTLSLSPLLEQPRFPGEGDKAGRAWRAKDVESVSIRFSGKELWAVSNSKSVVRTQVDGDGKLTSVAVVGSWEALDVSAYRVKHAKLEEELKAFGWTAAVRDSAVCNEVPPCGKLRWLEYRMGGAWFRLHRECGLGSDAKECRVSLWSEIGVELEAK